jgi:hypothetical protein
LYKEKVAEEKRVAREAANVARERRRLNARLKERVNKRLATLQKL